MKFAVVLIANVTTVDFESMNEDELLPQNAFNNCSAQRSEARGDGDTAVAKIKDVLSARVADVKPSKNLAKSVARLIADENAMDAQMERFMRMHNADFKGAPKILEVNAKHPLITALNDRLATGDFAEADDFAELIYQSALISDGKQVDDPHAFAEKLAKVMQKAL